MSLPRAITRPRRACDRCGYDVATFAAAGLPFTCPECGSTLSPTEAIQPGPSLAWIARTACLIPALCWLLAGLAANASLDACGCLSFPAGAAAAVIGPIMAARRIRNECAWHEDKPALFWQVIFMGIFMNAFLFLVIMSAVMS